MCQVAAQMYVLSLEIKHGYKSEKIFSTRILNKHKKYIKMMFHDTKKSFSANIN